MNRIGNSDIINSTLKSNKPLIFLSMIFLAGSIGIKNLRWIVLLSVISKIKKMHSSMIYFAGQITNEIFPTGSGELVRAHFFNKLDESSYGKPLGALLVERTMDTLLLLLIATIGIRVMFSNIGDYIVVILFGFFIVFLASLFFIKPSLFTSVISVFHKISLGFFASRFAKIREVAKGFDESIKIYQKNKKIIILAFSITIIAWFLDAFAQLTMLKAFYYSATFPQMLGVVGLSWIIGTFSFIPGGLGAREVTFAYLLDSMGIPLIIGLSASLVYRAFVYLEFGILGGVSLLKLTR